MRNIACTVVCLFIVTWVIARQLPDTSIDVQHYRFALEVNDSTNIIQGEAIVTVKFLQDAQQLKLDLTQQNKDGKGMLVTAVEEDGKAASFAQDAQYVIINTTAHNGDVSSYKISYQGIPADGLIISTNLYKHRTFFGDNWPNRAHNWLPCKDHLSDKAPVEFIVTAPSHYQVVANGVQTEQVDLPGNRRLSHWVSDAELPTKVMVIGIADFAVNYIGEVENIPVYSWVYPENKDSGFAAYAIAKDILPYYISHVGPYAYKKLANVQSKTIFGGMENASAIFYYEKSVTNAGLEALMAHEIAHQWFGDNATEKNWQHLWLSEGFATYMTNLYHENKYGVDSLNKRLITDREAVIKFSKKRNTPVVDTTYGNDMMQLLNDNSYQKGGWVLHMLRRRLGDETFWKCVRAYYAQYGGHNASTEDLQQVFENISNQNLQQFFMQWLYTPGQPKLNIQWQYKQDEKAVVVTVEQQQNTLFAFPLEIAVKMGPSIIYKTVGVKDKNTTFAIPVAAKPTGFIVDPHVNLLYEGVVKEMQ